MKPKSSEITSESTYQSRRQFIKGAGATLAGAILLNGCGQKTPDQAKPRPGKTKSVKDDLGDPLTPFAAVTHYNNYFEFTTDKEDVAEMASGFKTIPWTIKVGGFVRKPKTYDIDDLIRKFGEEERVYRLRCVEAWSMVIPWLGFPLAKLLKEVEPTSKAKYVRFTSLLDPKEMPGQNNTSYYWPYIEGLRLDEAMNDLTLLSHGLYGKALLPQCGAPLRLVVPWKYGFKSAKAIVRIDLVKKMPVSLWMQAAPTQYGFYANVNPKVQHVRWSQSTERRIGELSRRKTLLLNGYDEKVAGLYSNKRLNEYF